MDLSPYLINMQSVSALKMDAGSKESTWLIVLTSKYLVRASGLSFLSNCRTNLCETGPVIPRVCTTQSRLLTTLCKRLLENMENRENAYNQYFLLFPQCFFLFPKQISIFQ